MSKPKSWHDRVSTIFSIFPRSGSVQTTLWVDRQDKTAQFSEKYLRLGGHVCLDGPTGSGKTSFVWTYLEKQAVRYVQVQLTKHLDWPGFCHLLIDPETYSDETCTTDLEAGMDKLLPVLKFRISLGAKKESDKYDYIQKASATWTEHDVARRMKELNATLLVDDVEQGNDVLVARLSDLCKLLTQTYVAPNARVIFVGSNEIYRRIYQHNKSLEGRLFQVSLGGFTRPELSVSLIRRGLRRLDLWNPWHNPDPSERRKSAICSEKIWEAADGSPKLLNELGNDIVADLEGKRRVPAQLIVERADRMVQDNWVRHSATFPEVYRFLCEHPIAEEIVRFIYKNGIFRIFEVSRIVDHVRNVNSNFTAEQTEKHLAGLCALEFCVRTGQNNEVIFIRQPTAAHQLGVAALHPERFQSFAELVNGQRPVELYPKDRQGFYLMCELPDEQLDTLTDHE